MKREWDKNQFFLIFIPLPSIIETFLYQRNQKVRLILLVRVKNSWTISYKVPVKNNKITSANGGTFKAVLGNFSNTSVKWYLENKLGNNSCSNTKFNECCQPNNKHMDIIKKY